MPREIAISSFPGSQIDITHPNLLNLISSGYEFGQETVKQSEIEYHGADIVYLAKEGDLEIGSLSVKLRPNMPGDPFWQNVRIPLSDLSDINFLACYIHGSVVNPSYRRRGVASLLLRRMIEDYNPLAILGQTKSPEAVSARAKTLYQKGYRTFFGFYEVTPVFGSEREHEGREFVSAAIKSEEIEPSETGVYEVDSNVMLPYIPDSDGFPPEIQRAFQQIQKAQKNLGITRTAVTVLVSVKSFVFNKNN